MWFPDSALQVHSRGVGRRGGFNFKMTESCSGKWREMVGKGEDDGLRTVECLRGRLQAERVASRAAKEESDLMAKRLTELERVLAAEIKARNRAEKRLKYALKKLESLKLPEFPALSNTSEEISGEGESPGNLSSTCSSDLQMTRERKSSSQNEEPGQCDAREESEGTGDLVMLKDNIGDEEGSVDSLDDSAEGSVSQEGSWSSVGTAHSVNKGDSCCKKTAESQESFQHGKLVSDTNRKSSTSEEENDDGIHQIEYADDTLALVPATLWPDSRNNELRKANSGNSETRAENKLNSADNKLRKDSNVQDVLVALRHVKEQLQSSMARRTVAITPRELCSL